MSAAVSDVKAGSFTRGASDFIMPGQELRKISIFLCFSVKTFRQEFCIAERFC